MLISGFVEICPQVPVKKFFEGFSPSVYMSMAAILVM